MLPELQWVRGTRDIGPYAPEVSEGAWRRVMEFQLFLIVVVIVLLVIVLSARRGLRGGTRAGALRQCPGCMAGLPAHAQFCSRCGRKQG